MAAYKKRWRAQRRAAGLCTTCANPCDLPDRVRCSACQRKDKEDYRRLFERNPIRFLAAVHRRRARKKGNGGTFTLLEWKAIKRLQDYTCLMCRKREPEIKLCIDHVISINDGGPNIASNIQGLCKSCNSIKGDRCLDLRPHGPWF